MRWETERYLAIDPTVRGFGYVLISKDKVLLDWGSVYLKDREPRGYRARVRKLLEQFGPTYLILESARGSRRGERARAVQSALAAMARGRSVGVRRIRAAEVRATFASYGSTKYEIACALAKTFPEIADRLPRRRMPWMSEDERMGIFDALAFALTAIDLSST